MAIEVSAAEIAPDDVDVLGVPVFADRDVPDGTGVELDLGFLETSGFEGKVGETAPLLADDGSTIVAVGVGARDRVDADQLRRAAAAFARKASRSGRAAFVLPAGYGLTQDAFDTATAHGAAMA